MSLNELATSQPVTSGPTPDESENVMTDAQVDEASTTTGNVDDVQGNETNEVEAVKDKTQQRINELVSERNRARDELIAEKAAREAIERNMDHFSQDSQPDEKKLSDLSSAQLKEFINTARGNEELEDYIPEAQEYLTEKLVDERFSKFTEDKTAKDSVQEGQELTNIMLNNIAGDQLSNPDSEYYQSVIGEMNNLASDKFKNVNRDQLLAVLITENDRLKSQANGPTLPEKIIENRNVNNTVRSNNRSVNYGGSNLNTVLQDNAVLTTSKQGKHGSLRDAIKELGAVKSFEG